MPTIFEGLGSEALVDIVFLALRDNMDDALAVQQARWDAHDQYLAAQLDMDWTQLVLEPIPLDNFHVGSIPSFVGIEDRVANYPMLVVVPGRTTPDAENAMLDQIDVYSNAVAIHTFSRASDAEGATIAYRRAMRMAEAVHYVVHNDTTLRSVTRGVAGPLLVERSEPWYFPPEDGHGEDWCWMAVMHQYAFRNYSQTPRG
jgi:hypothetical protein